MGYTHYFGFKKPSKNEVKKIDALYKKTLIECQKVCHYWYKQNKGTDNSISGFSAHTKLGQYGGFDLNGARDYKCENLALPEHYSDLFKGNFWGFCKTNRLPYDTVVVACLAVLKYRLKDYINISSDANYHDLTEGTELASKVLNRKIKNPIKFIPERDLKVA